MLLAGLSNIGGLVMNCAADVWAKVMDLMENELGMSATTLATWFDDVNAVSLTNTKLVLVTPAQFKKEIILNHHAAKIREALKLLFSADMDFEIYAEEEISTDHIQRVQDEASEDEYSFERFVVGDSNKFAHAAAKAVANTPGQTYNPLLIYGGSGLGKTHLLKAIASVIRKNNPDSKVVYVKGDDFTNELIDAIQTGTIPDFRNKYRISDALLVDDIQFIAGKASTQEEFFHTFNTLYEDKKQIVLTSDRLPMEMVTLEERLRTRFEWGLMADIQPPNFETRMAIISLKANRLGLQLEQKHKEIIANNVTANVRQIEGTVKKILAYRDLLSDTITQDTIERAIKDMFMENRNQIPTPDIIIKEVCKYYQTDPNAITGKNRSKDTVLPRQVAMYLIREITSLSYPDIGKHFGNRDHTTVMHAVNKVDSQMKQQDDFRSVIKDIRNNILES